MLSDGVSFVKLRDELLVPEWRELYWNETVFRHRRGPDDLITGPNALLADGHVEYTIDLTVLTEDNGNIE